MDFTALAAIITATAALIGVFYNAAKQKQESEQAARRYDLDALRYVVDDLTEENTRLRERLKDLEAQLDSKTKRIQDLEAQVATLEAQVKELGDTPRKASRRGTGPLGA